MNAQIRPVQVVKLFSCVFPRCREKNLTAERIFVPHMKWCYEQIHFADDPSQPFKADNPPTEAELAQFGRCHHHTFESVVGIEFNQRRGVAGMFLLSKTMASIKERQDKRADEEANRLARKAERRAAQRQAPVVAPKPPKNYGSYEPKRPAPKAPKKGKGKGKKK